MRMLDARVCRSFTVVPCCKANPDLLCYWDFHEEDTDRQVIVLSLALARAEGREDAATAIAELLMEAQADPSVLPSIRGLIEA